ncbi:hypothetical protein LCGC14_0772850, partial [marine sediment metagenome]
SGNVRPKGYFKKYPDGSAPDSAFTAFSAAFSDIAIPATADFVYDTEILTLSALGLTVNNFYNFEHTRDAGNAADTYVGDWFVKMNRIRVL